MALAAINLGFRACKHALIRGRLFSSTITTAITSFEEQP